MYQYNKITLFYLLSFGSMQNVNDFTIYIQILSRLIELLYFIFSMVFMLKNCEG